MVDRDRRRAQATATDRTRRIRDAARRQDLSGEAHEGAAGRAPRGRWRGRIRVAILLAAAALIVGTVLLGVRLSAFNEQVSHASSITELFGPLGGERRVNVVLYGYGGEAHQGGKFLADSINILSIDPVTNATTIIPIPRDLWIEGYPSQLPENGKINEAFAVGYQVGGVPYAAELTNGLLAEVTGLDLDYWVALDFAGFRAMVDAVGGVTVDNPTAFSFTWFEDEYHAGVFPDGTFPVGALMLDGEHALSYARARYTDVASEQGDFARSIRQQRVLLALRQQLGDGLGSLGPGLRLMDAVQDRMETNLSVIDLMLLAGRVDPARRIELAEDVILEATSNSIGQYILVVIGRGSGTDYQPLRDYLRLELAKPIPTPAPSASVPSASTP